MRVAILGLGSFGFHLAEWLQMLGNEVIAIDADEHVVQRIKNRVSKAVTGDFTNHELLDEIGIREIDVAMIAPGHRLEASALLANYLKEAGVKRIVAKVDDEEQGRILKLVGASDTMQPDRDFSAKAAAMLTFPRLLDYVVLSGEHRILVVKVPSSLAGKTVGECESELGDVVKILVVDPPGDETPPLAPLPTHKLSRDDIIVIMGGIRGLLKLIHEE